MIRMLCSELSRSKVTKSSVKPRISAFILFLCSSNMAHLTVNLVQLTSYCNHERIHCSFLFFVFWHHVPALTPRPFWFNWAVGDQRVRSVCVFFKNAVKKKKSLSPKIFILQYLNRLSAMEGWKPSYLSIFFSRLHKELDTQKTCKW